MKTLHISNSWHAASGGISTFYRALFDTANQQRHLMRLIVPSHKTRVEKVGNHGLIYHLKAPRAPFNPEYHILLPQHYLFPGAAVGRIIADERPDLVEICDKYSLPYVAGLLYKQWLPSVRFRPTIVGFSCERMDDNVAAYVSPSQAARAFTRFVMRSLYFPMFDHHITNSEYTAEELRQAAGGHRVQRDIWVRPMGVDLEGFSPAQRRPDFRSELIAAAAGTEESVLLLYAGRLAPEKNLPLLVETMRDLAGEQRDYRLLIAGSGILAASLEAECERVVPGRVRFLGHIADRKRLARIYANSDALVHPNPREPFGITLLEAMASGLPVVAPNTGGVTTYSHSGNAWIAPPNGPDFATAIRSLAANPDERNARAAEALRTASRLAWPTITREFLMLYDIIHARTRAKLGTVETGSQSAPSTGFPAAQ